LTNASNLNEIERMILDILQDDSIEKRKELARSCFYLLHKEYYAYLHLDYWVQDAIGELVVEKELNGKIEPWIMHMGEKDIKRIYERIISKHEPKKT